MSDSTELYYKNLPKQISKSIKLITKLGHIKGYESFFLDKKPCFLVQLPGRIYGLENLFLTKRELEQIKNLSLKIYLVEPLNFVSEDQRTIHYAEFIGSEKLDSIKSYELESIKKFANNNNLNDIQVFTCDYNVNIIQPNYPELVLYCYDICIRAQSSNTLVSTKDVEDVEMRNSGNNDIYKLKNKYKNSFNIKFWLSSARYTAHRHILSCYLSHLNSKIGWNFQCSEISLLENPWFKFDEINNNLREKILLGNDNLNRGGYVIDIPTPVEKVENYNQHLNGMEETYHWWNEKYLSSLEDCFCAVVLESRFAQPTGNISEKTFLPIMNKMPFVLAAPPYSLEYMKNLGFQSFDKWWDESYDLEKNHQTRMLKIFEVIDYINTKNIEDLKVMYDEMKDVLDNNLQILQKLAKNKKFF